MLVVAAYCLIVGALVGYLARYVQVQRAQRRWHVVRYSVCHPDHSPSPVARGRAMFDGDDVLWIDPIWIEQDPEN